MNIDEAVAKLKQLIDDGKSMKEIAQESGIYYQTVRQINNDKSNLQVKTIRKLVSYLEKI